MSKEDIVEAVSEQQEEDNNQPTLDSF